MTGCRPCWRWTERWVATRANDRQDRMSDDSLADTTASPDQQSPTHNQPALRASTSRLGLVIARWSRSTSYSTPGPVSTGMGDRLRVGKPPWLITSHSGQLSLLGFYPQLDGKYRPKHGDALRLGSKGRYGSLYFTWSTIEAKCSGHSRLCVCLSLAAFPLYCMDPDVTWGNGRGCPLVVHYWADLQSVHGFCSYDNTHVYKLIALYTANAYSAKCKMSNAKCQRVLVLYGWFHLWINVWVAGKTVWSLVNTCPTWKL